MCLTPKEFLKSRLNFNFLVEAILRPNVCNLTKKVIFKNTVLLSDSICGSRRNFSKSNCEKLLLKLITNKVWKITHLIFFVIYIVTYWWCYINIPSCYFVYKLEVIIYGISWARQLNSHHTQLSFFLKLTINANNMGKVAVNIVCHKRLQKLRTGGKHNKNLWNGCLI